MAHSSYGQGSSARCAVELAMSALERALRPEGGITAATETRVQNAIDLLRASSSESGDLAELESIAVELRVLVEANRLGRPNFYASRLIRLRRRVLPC